MWRLPHPFPDRKSLEGKILGILEEKVAEVKYGTKPGDNVRHAQAPMMHIFSPIVPEDSRARTFFREERKQLTDS